jgi:hypothetical protein
LPPVSPALLLKQEELASSISCLTTQARELASNISCLTTQAEGTCLQYLLPYYSSRALLAICPHAVCLLGLFFNPEDKGAVIFLEADGQTKLNSLA